MSSHAVTDDLVSPHQLIEDIRRRYRVDDPHNEDDPYRDIARNTIPLVTEELYESQTHFFSELLQNADDNEYPAGVVPELIVESYDDRIEILNNELGFEPKHVRALCGLAQSTKRDRKDSATGEKGIGFKAVFQVTDTPHVHSAGFHFRFDKSFNPPFGLVIPEWWPDDPRGFDGTRIVLPLKKGFQLPADFLKSLQPELLLFLRSIRRLEFRDVDYKQTVMLARHDRDSVAHVVRTVADSVDEKRNSTADHRFFIHRRSVSMEDITEEKRSHIEATEVAIALPLDSDGAVDPPSRGCTLFAFLPVMETQLPFLCHADFVLTTSREKISKDLPWNQRLRDELGHCLADGILKCRDSPVLGTSALRSLSQPKSIQDPFLRTVVSLAIDRLKEEQCIPLVNKQWGTPDQALAPDQNGLWELIDPVDLASQLSLQLADPTAERIQAALKLLGVKTFSLSHLLSCIAVDEWRASRSPHWWARLYAKLGPLCSSATARQQIANAPILPLESGDIVAPSSTNVFRSLSRERRYGFEHDLNILDSRVIGACSKDDRGPFEAFLKAMGIADATPLSVIDKHILPIHTADEWTTKSDSVLTGHARYLRDQIGIYTAKKPVQHGKPPGHAIGCRFHIRSTARDPQHRYQTVDDLYLGTAYNDPYSLEDILAGEIADSRVSPDYLNESFEQEGDDRATAWRELFVSLGAMTLPQVVRLPNSMDNVWDDEVLACLAAPNPPRQERLIRLIGDHWIGYYSRWSTRRGFTNTPSSLLTALQSCCVQTTDGNLWELGACYLQTEANVAVFGNSVPYLTFKVDPDFADALGVVREPTVAHALDRLRELRDKAESDLRIVAPLYKFLESRYSQNATEINEAFASDSLLIADVAGALAWVAPSEARWRIPKALRRHSALGSLEGTWRGLYEFCTKHLGVEEFLTGHDWIDVLKSLSECEEDHESVTKVVPRIYTAISQLLDCAKDEDCDEWLDRLRGSVLLYTTSREWRANESNVFVADDSVLAELFEDAEEVAFLAVPPEDITRLQPLCEALDVRSLSEVIDTSMPSDADSALWSDFGETLEARFRIIARFLHHKHPAAFNEAIENGTLLALRDLSAHICSPLALRVELCGVSRCHAFPVRLVLDGAQYSLLIDDQFKNDWIKIGIEMGRLLGLSDTDSFPLGDLLGRDDTGVAQILDGLSIPELPQELGQLLFGDTYEDLFAGDEENQKDVRNGIALPAVDEVGSSDVLQESFHTLSDVPPDDDDEIDSMGESEKVALDSQEPSGTLDNEVTSSLSPGDALHLDEELVAEEQGQDGPSSRAGAVETGGNSARQESTDAQSAFPETAQAKPNPKTAPATLRGEVEAPADSQELPESATTAREGELPCVESEARTPTAPTAPKDPSSKNRRRETRRGGHSSERLRSYVEPDERRGRDLDGDPDDTVEQRDKQVEVAAVRLAMRHETLEGRAVRDLNTERKNNKGYDLVSGSSSGEVERFIEVKGVSGAWGDRGVMVTPAQFEFAARHGVKAWLYVVEHALSDAPRLYRIQDFARRVWRFGFDDGWEAVAESSPGEDPKQLPDPVIGMRVRLSDGRIGQVIQVSGAGRLRGVIVALDSGDEERIQWNVHEVSGESEDHD